MMNKYIVKVNHSNNQVSIITLKAKNYTDLELKIAKEIKDIFDNLNEINSIEYEKVERFTFNKKDYHWFVGTTYVGGELLEDYLNTGVNNNEKM